MDTIAGGTGTLGPCEVRDGDVGSEELDEEDEIDEVEGIPLSTSLSGTLAPGESGEEDTAAVAEDEEAGGRLATSAAKHVFVVSSPLVFCPNLIFPASNTWYSKFCLPFTAWALPSALVCWWLKSSSSSYSES